MATVKININGEIVEMDQAEVSKAIETGEVKIESDKLIVKSEDNIIYTKDEFEKYNKNLKNEEYKNGKTAGEEMAFKAMKNASGYTGR
jgi:lipopolysaccharide export system protein LptA